MDPDELLVTIRHLMVDKAQAESEESYSRLNALNADIADLFGPLDEWLSKGGFLPKAWQR